MARSASDWTTHERLITRDAIFTGTVQQAVNSQPLRRAGLYANSPDTSAPALASVTVDRGAQAMAGDL